MNDYDKAGRYLVKRDPGGVLGWLLGRPGGVPFHQWLDARRVALPDQGDLTHDLVAACRAGDGLEGYCVELQAESDADTAGRVVYEYVPRLVREAGGVPLAGVGGVVVNFTGPPQPSKVGQRLALAPACRAGGRVVQRTLRKVSAARLAGEVEAGRASAWLLGWLPLMRGGKKPGILQAWRRAAESLPDARDRGILAGLALTFSTLVECRPVWERGLEGFNVIKSPYLEDLREAVRADGRAEGAAAALRGAILRLGEKRFGKAANKKQRAGLEAVADLPRLERMLDHVLAAATWAELLDTP